jgi:hypothetical protein
MSSEPLTDPAEVASLALEELIHELSAVEGYDLFEVLNGINSELIRQLLDLLGPEQTEDLLMVNLEAVLRFADLQPRDDLSALEPMGSA